MHINSFLGAAAGQGPGSGSGGGGYTRCPYYTEHTVRPILIHSMLHCCGNCFQMLKCFHCCFSQSALTPLPHCTHCPSSSPALWHDWLPLSFSFFQVTAAAVVVACPTCVVVIDLSLMGGSACRLQWLHSGRERQGSREGK